MLSLSKEAKKFYCFNCNQEIAFNQKVKADSGKSIPLVPGTTTPHKCPETEQISGEQIGSSEQLKQKLESKPETPPYREFDEVKTKDEVKRICVWARAEANSINFPVDFNKNSATTDELRARQIDRNVDKKDLMLYYFYTKYADKKKNSVDYLP